ncbi:MAG: glutamate 5-kinase [bacterium]|nr:glutamate 5-kinase [bacterium]
MKPQYKTIVVKIGTNALLAEDGTVHTKRIVSIAKQIIHLRKNGVKVILVSSGAMGCARALISPSKARSPVEERQLLAAVGQVELMLAYKKAFSTSGITVAQVLATKDDFRSRGHYLNMRQCFEILLKEGVVPIVNENDVVSVEELMFTDNDELAGLVSSMMQADALIMLTCLDGVIAESSDSKTQKIIDVIDPSKTIDAIECKGKSSFGRGGMETKLHVAKNVSSLGITTHIVNAATSDILGRIVSGEKIGTTVLPKKVKRSSTQRWLASSTTAKQGSVTVNGCVADVLMSDKPINLLPIGILSVTGEFVKGDVVSVSSPKGKVIGIGKAGYDSAKLQKVLGKKGQTAFIRSAYFVPLS